MGEPYPGCHLAHSDEPQGAAREGEYVARAKPSDEILFHRAESLAANEGDLHGGFAHDGSNGHTVPHCHHAVAGDVASVAFYDLVVLGIRAECRASPIHEIHHPAPFTIGEVAIGPRGADLGQQFVRPESTPYGNRYHVL